MTTLPPDIEIARAAKLLPLPEIAAKVGIPADGIELHGSNKAKVTQATLEDALARKHGKLVLVTAITPTPAGEGKTTTSIGLLDGLNRIGKQAAACLREPSLGPCFGMKGGAAGGGNAQVVPMEEINLHFTGDIHAIGIANNLLAACLDNHLQQGNALGIDQRRVTWRRVMDLNDRALRHTNIGLGGVGNSIPREDGFDITVASEVMAIFCLAKNIIDLKERLGKIVVGMTHARKMITASQLKCHGAMAVLLKDAIHPNLVQTLENNPCFIHGGPFANIAHGCNSALATLVSLGCSDYTITEAGFGADLGAQKFLDIKCRELGIAPDVVVIVATVRALKMHGGVDLKELGTPDVAAVTAGATNLEKHIANMQKYGLPVIVAINAFSSDTPEEIAAVEQACEKYGVKAVMSDHWARGGAGAEDLAREVVNVVEADEADFKMLYADDVPLWDKICITAKEIYGADDAIPEKKLVMTKLKRFTDAGYAECPVCIAKTQYSFSTDPTKKGCPTGFNLPIRDVRLSAGAGFVVALAGEIMTMPGLPRVPAAEAIDLDEHGNVVGLF